MLRAVHLERESAHPVSPRAFLTNYQLSVGHSALFSERKLLKSPMGRVSAVSADSGETFPKNCSAARVEGAGEQDVLQRCDLFSLI